MSLTRRATFSQSCADGMACNRRVCFFAHVEVSVPNRPPPCTLSTSLVCEQADVSCSLQTELRKPEDDPTVQNGSQADLAAGAFP